MVRAGEADIVIAGGMESMTNAPYLLPGARAGYRIGDQSVVDSMMFDGLTCAFDHCAMGLATERYNHGQISRARQDEFSARSHQLAAKAIAVGRVCRRDRANCRAPAPRRARFRRHRRGRARRHHGRVARSAARARSKKTAPSRRATRPRSLTARRPCS